MEQPKNIYEDDDDEISWEQLAMIENAMSQWTKNRQSNITRADANSETYEKNKQNKFRVAYFNAILPACSLFLEKIKKIDNNRKEELEKKLREINDYLKRVEAYKGNEVSEKYIDKMDKVAREIIELCKKEKGML